MEDSVADSFFTKLKKRNVFKVGVAYLVLAWVVIQVADVIVPALALPDWTITFLVIVGMFGFPFAIFFAWAFEITPDGIKKESELSSEEAVFAHSGRKLDFVIIGLLAVALGYFIYESRFQTQPNEAVIEEILVEAAQQNKVDKEPVGASIAVLPFVNMSSDKEQEYFSDGISEEILNVLSQIPNLHVTSRSSSFAFKGKELDLKKVAKQLGVDHILEGSVRKSGTTIRITAQLIEASSDRHLWSESYDRELTDVFAIQDELSAAIVTVLKIKLMGDSADIKVGVHKVVPEAYTSYLKGLHFLNKSELKTALKYFDDAINFDNTYATAHAFRGLILNVLTKSGAISLTEGPQMARMAINNALEIDPDLAIAFVFRALNKLWFDFDVKGALLDFELAIEINPNTARAYESLSYLYSIMGKHQQAVLYAQMALTLDPMTTLMSRRLIQAYLYMGDYQQALAEIEVAYTNSTETQSVVRLHARVDLAVGNSEHALLLTNKITRDAPMNMTQAIAYSNLGNKAKSDEALARFIKRGAHDSAYQIAEIYCARGEIQQCLDWLERAYKQKDPGLLRLMISPFLKPAFQEKRYKELVLKMNIH